MKDWRFFRETAICQKPLNAAPQFARTEISDFLREYERWNAGGSKAAPLCPTGLARQIKIEGGPLFGLAYRPDLAAMTMDNPLDRGQPNAGAWKLRGAVQTLKYLKQLAGICHI